MAVWHPPHGVESIGSLFARQDAAVQQNAVAAAKELLLIETGLLLALDVTLRLNEEPVLSQRRTKPNSESRSETIVMNLLYAGWSSLVDATRLTLFGARVNALALVRSAFEATLHAEYFRSNPADAAEWDAAGALTDLFDVRDRVRDFDTKKRVRDTVRRQYGGPRGSHDRFFVELFAYGTHTNPKTAALRLASGRAAIANFGFMAIGKNEATRFCAIRVLDALGYLLSEFQDAVPSYLALHPDLAAEVAKFRVDLATARATQAAELSLSI
jgi:hypothetical protein